MATVESLATNIKYVVLDHESQRTKVTTLAETYFGRQNRFRTAGTTPYGSSAQDMIVKPQLS